MVQAKKTMGKGAVVSCLARMLHPSQIIAQQFPTINKNKRLDEIIKKYGITIAMVILMADAGIFVLGVTYRYRHTQTPMTADEKQRALETQRFLESASKGNIERTMSR